MPRATYQILNRMLKAAIPVHSAVHFSSSLSAERHLVDRVTFYTDVICSRQRSDPFSVVVYKNAVRQMCVLRLLGNGPIFIGIS